MVKIAISSKGILSLPKSTLSSKCSSLSTLKIYMIERPRPFSSFVRTGKTDFSMKRSKDWHDCLNWPKMTSSMALKRWCLRSKKYSKSTPQTKTTCSIKTQAATNSGTSNSCPHFWTLCNLSSITGNTCLNLIFYKDWKKPLWSICWDSPSARYPKSFWKRNPLKTRKTTSSNQAR